MFTQAVRARFIRIVSVAVLVALFATGRSTADNAAEFVGPFDVALGPPDAAVAQVDLALGPEMAIAVYVCTDLAGVDGICYAVNNRPPSEISNPWTESAQPIPSSVVPAPAVRDPVVAYNRFSDSFVATALQSTGGLNSVVVSRFDGSKFEPWRALDMSGITEATKPWLEAGAADEFYMTVFDKGANRIHYGRTTDGGARWVIEKITVDMVDQVCVNPNVA